MTSCKIFEIARTDYCTLKNKTYKWVTQRKFNSNSVAGHIKNSNIYKSDIKHSLPSSSRHNIYENMGSFQCPYKNY